MPACFPCVPIQEVGDKQGNVFASLPQGRQLYGKDVQPVKQVAAELARFDRGLQVAIGGGGHPHVGPNGSASSDALKFAFLKEPQKSNLSFCREFSYVVQEERAFLRQFEASQTPLRCPREGALLMAK